MYVIFPDVFCKQKINTEYKMSENRELFASRIGFILMTAGCAIGLGNIWRFPYVAGQYGGGLFVLMYMIFLIIIGFPVMLMELALGRAGRSTFPGAFRNLQNPGSRAPWSRIATVLFSGNFILLMFYVPVTGWLLAYSFYGIADGISAINEIGADNFFRDFMADWQAQIIFMAGALLITVAVCMGGVRKSVEKVIKYMMGGLFVLLGVLVVRALTLEGAGDGVKFFLMPDPAKISEHGWLATVTAALSQAFFTLSLGIGSIAVCGSYFDRKRSLPQEGIVIIILDTLVAICAGLVVFPACYAFDVAPDAGPSLIFVTLPRVFENMPYGTVWTVVFFAFLAVAALSTLIAVFENLTAYGMDEFGLKRIESSLLFGGALLVMSVPCILGANLWSNISILGMDIQSFEDFIVSDNLLPLGSLILVLFCGWRWGWGCDNFYKEVNTGIGWKYSRLFIPYIKYVLPVIIFLLWCGRIAEWFFA